MLHPLAEDYLDRLERAADHLPGARRRELVEDIRSHLSQALGASPVDAEVAVELERLGDPQEIAEAEAPRPTPAKRFRDWRPTPLLSFALLVGGLFIGPLLLLGIVAMCVSRGWGVRDRALVAGLFVVSFGIVVAVTLPILDRANQLCGLRYCMPNSNLEIALGYAAALLPLLPAGYVAYVASRATRRSPLTPTT